MKILDGLVVPHAKSLIGSKLVHIEQSTHILAETSVDTVDIRAAVRAVRATGGKTGIAFCQKGSICVFSIEDVLGKGDIRVNRGDVEIAHAGVQSCKHHRRNGDY